MGVEVDTILKIVAVGGPIALAVMGFIVVDKPPKKKGRVRIYWYCAFALVAVISIFAAVIDSKKSESHLEEMLTGGGHYCFYKADPNVRTNTDEFILWINCTGPLYNLTTWIAPADATSANNPRYWSLQKGQKFLETFTGGVMSGLSLGVGEYRIEMSARNGTAIEIIKIISYDGKISQSIEVSRQPGGNIYSE
jgi:hypothetical protein